MPAPLTVAELARQYPELRPVIIDNLIRRGEVGTLVSTSKAYKSWLLLSTALTVATGGRVLDTFDADAVPVLLLDYELHPATLNRRLGAVMHAMRLSPADVGDALSIVCFRGQRHRPDAFTLSRYIEGLGRTFGLIIVDPIYKMYTHGFDENDNAAMTELYARLQEAAEAADAGLLVVHHTSKGDQSAKSVVDVGAGAGAQARASDCHLILRRHEEDDAAVLHGVVRSFPPFDPLTIRWEYPLWQPAPELDPEALYRPPRRGRRAKADDTPPPPPKPSWTVDQFVADFVTGDPQGKDAILDAALSAGIANTHQAETLLKRAEATGKAHRIKLPKDRRAYYANAPQVQPLTDGT